MNQIDLSQMIKSTARVGLLGFLAFLIIYPGSIYFVSINQFVPFVLTALIGEILFFVTFYLENKIAKKYQVQWEMKEIMGFFLVMLFFALVGSSIALLLKDMYGINAKVLGTVLPILAGSYMFLRRKKRSSKSIQDIAQFRFSCLVGWLIGAYILATVFFIVILMRFPAQG